MILAAHAIVGAAISSQIPNHPITALAAGIASHFAIDAIPHWDYPLRSMLRGSKGSPLTLDKELLVDFSLIARWINGPRHRAFSFRAAQRASHNFTRRSRLDVAGRLPVCASTVSTRASSYCSAVSQLDTFKAKTRLAPRHRFSARLQRRGRPAGGRASNVSA